MPSGLFGPVRRIFAPTTKLFQLLSPYRRFTKGASGRYAGAIVKVVGTVIGRFNAVAGSVCVASTTPGRSPPTVEPIPGKLSAPLNVPLLALATGGPSCALNPG